jgi:hypothetical protein
VHLAALTGEVKGRIETKKAKLTGTPEMKMPAHRAVPEGGPFPSEEIKRNVPSGEVR